MKAEVYRKKREKRHKRHQRNRDKVVISTGKISREFYYQRPHYVSSLFTCICTLFHAKKLLLSYILISLSPFHLQFLPITQIFYSVLNEHQNFPKKEHVQHSVRYVTRREKNLSTARRAFSQCVCEHTIHFLFRLDSGEQGAPRLVLHFSRGIHFCLSTRRNLAQVHTLSTSLSRLCLLPLPTSPTTLLRFSSKRSSLGYVSGFNSGFAAVHARCHKGVKTPRCVSFGTAIRFRSVTTELVLAARGNGATREIVVTRSFTPLPPPGSESRFRSVEQPTRSPPSFLPRAAFYAPFRSSFATALHRSSLAWTRDPRS